MLGIDALGLAHPNFPVRGLIQAVPRNWAIGCFDDDQNAFGDVLPKLRKVLASGKFPVCRIQAHWSDQHHIVPLPKLRKKLPAYEALAREFPVIRIYVSHSCEHSERRQELVDERMALIRELAPSCIPVNCPYRGALSEGSVNEEHGALVALEEPYFVSMDGKDFRDLDVKRWRKDHRNAEMIFGWRSEFNLRLPNKPAPPPMERKLRVTRKHIAEVVAAMRRR